VIVTEGAQAGEIAAWGGGIACHKRWYAPGPVQPQGPTFSLAGAGSVLIGSTAACIVAGALVGWALGSFAYGLAFGAVVGIPVGIATTVIKYRNV